MYLVVLKKQYRSDIEKRWLHGVGWPQMNG
jgi:hypothetical protein